VSLVKLRLPVFVNLPVDERSSSTFVITLPQMSKNN
jgi:hypothetical protein